MMLFELLKASYGFLPPCQEMDDQGASPHLRLAGSLKVEGLKVEGLESCIFENLQKISGISEISS